MSTKLPAPPVVIDRRQRYSILEACALLRLSRSWVFKEIRAGRIETFKEGRRTYISGATLIKRSRPPVTPTSTRLAEECAA